MLPATTPSLHSIVARMNLAPPAKMAGLLRRPDSGCPTLPAKMAGLLREKPVPLRWVVEFEPPTLNPFHIIVPRIIPPAAIVASLHSVRSHETPIEEAIFPDRLIAILGTGRGEVADIALSPRPSPPIDSNGRENEPLERLELVSPLDCVLNGYLVGWRWFPGGFRPLAEKKCYEEKL